MTDLEQATQEMNDTRPHCQLCTKILNRRYTLKTLHPQCNRELNIEMDALLKESMDEKRKEYATYRKWRMACFAYYTKGVGFFD